MSDLILLDTGVLGFVTNPKASVNDPVLDWLERLLNNGHSPIVPEIADYELRRELTRTKSRRAINHLDRLGFEFRYLPIDTAAMRRAAAFWAAARNEGRPLAHQHALDGDIILCAQARRLSKLNPSRKVIIATTNVSHLRRFALADTWNNI